MTTKLTTPPPHVWDKIEKILDEQDGRKQTEKLFSNSSNYHTGSKRTNFFLGSITGISIMLVFLLKYSHSLKIN